MNKFSNKKNTMYIIGRYRILPQPLGTREQYLSVE